MLTGWLLAACVLLVTVSGQGLCVPAASSPALLSLPFCSPVLPAGLVYYDPAWNTSAAINSAYAVVRQYGSLNSAHLGASRSCVDAAVAFVCSSWFSACTTVNNAAGSPVATFQQQCASDCQNFTTSSCYAGWAAFVNAAAVNVSTSVRPSLLFCNVTYAAGTPYIAGQPTVGSLTFSIDAQTSSTTQCRAPVVAAQTSTSFPCYSAYQATSPTAPDGPNGYCELKCPLFLNPDIAPQYVAQTVINWIIWPLALLALGLRLTVRKLSRYPANLVLFMLFGWFLAAFALALQVFWGYQGAMCTANRTPGTQYDPKICGFTGFMWPFGVYIYTFSWTAIAIHSAVAVVMKRDVFTVWSMVASYCSIILFALLFAVVPAGGGNIAALITNVYCFPTGNYAFGCFYAPIGFCLLVGSVACIVVFVQMLKVSDFGSSWSIKNNLRLTAFLILQLLWVCMIFGYRFSLQAPLGDGRLNQNLIALIGCSVYRECDRWTLPGFPLPPSAVWAVSVIKDVVGLLVVLLFLSQPENWTTSISDREAPWNNVLKTSSSDATATTAGSSSSSSGSGESTFVSDLQ